MVIKERTREQEKEAGELLRQYLGSSFSGPRLSIDLLPASRGLEGLGTKAKVILKEAPNASFFICISNEVHRPLRYVNT